MEGNNSSMAGGGAMLPGMASGILGLEIPLHQHQQHHHLPHQPHPQQQQQHHLLSFSAHQDQQNPNYTYPIKPKQQQQHQHPLSDDDDPGFPADDGAGDAAKKRVSPWHRMKWTDSMVRLLIMVVFYIGDDNSAAESTDPKKKSGAGALQKKGKWKSVSRAMMEKGFYVSPQQCEDKFNDLNKRYKRVNDILGKGTSCRVVENQSLLESMDNLNPKMKEEVKKLLNSKHLFFREMCAYHNSGHQQQERCFHSSDGANSRTRVAEPDQELVKHGEEEEEDDDEDEDDEDENEEDENEDEEESREDGLVQEDLNKRKRIRDCGTPTSTVAMNQLRSEMMGVLEDGSKSQWEQRQWMMRQLVQLEEQRVSYQCQALELEKKRLKWLKFSNKKEREMERLKIKNDRMKLENERMVLLLKKKEIELLHLHHHHQQQHSANNRPDSSSIMG